MAVRKTRSSRFIDVLEPFERVLIVTHDSPDPDAIAASWGIATLLRGTLGRPLRVVAGGAILRAENERMVELLSPPLELVEGLETAPEEAIVLVDCNPSAANHLLFGTGAKPVAVIDHHAPATPFRVRHRDLRSRIGATATIAAEYLREQDMQPDKELATGLVYGIQTDAIGWPALTRSDQRAITWLAGFADFNLLADIRSAALSRAYFADLVLALESTFVYEDTALCFLPRATGYEIVGEVADLLIRVAGVHRVACGASVSGDVILSVRTSDRGGDATALVNRMLEGIGRGGGHTHRAGGKIHAGARTNRVGGDLRTELRNRWLRACTLPPQRGTRLVPRREILENL